MRRDFDAARAGFSIFLPRRTCAIGLLAGIVLADIDCAGRFDLSPLQPQPQSRFSRVEPAG
jgi:hypothetical protein